MPIYEYICDDCGTKFEKLVRRNQDAIACPSCGESHLKTALSTFAAHSSNGKAQASKDQPSSPRAPEECVRRRISADGISRPAKARPSATLGTSSVDFRQRLRYSAEVLMYQRFVG